MVRVLCRQHRFWQRRCDFGLCSGVIITCPATGCFTTRTTAAAAAGGSVLTIHRRAEAAARIPAAGVPGATSGGPGARNLASSWWRRPRAASPGAGQSAPERTERADLPGPAACEQGRSLPHQGHHPEELGRGRGGPGATGDGRSARDARTPAGDRVRDARK